MSEHIKTGRDIWSEIQSPCCRDEYKTEKWISISWLKEQITEKNDYFMNLPGDLKDVRDLGRMDMLRWVLSLLEGE